MSDFERSGMTYDEPTKRRSPGTWFSDLGDRLARGFNNLDRPALDEDEPEWEEYDESEQPTTVGDWDPMPRSARGAGNRRFPTALHGYDPQAVDAHLAALEQELAELRVHRAQPPSVEAELERLGEETSAILKVAHEQAAEITRRAQIQADRCVSDAAANAVAMTEEAKRKLRHLDSETDAVWAERGRLIEDVRNVATTLFSLAEDAADRFPEEGDRRAPQATSPASQPAAAPPQTAPTGSPQTAATGSPQPAATGSPQPAATGSPHTAAAGSPQMARSIPRPAAAPPQSPSASRGPASAPPHREHSEDRPGG